MIDKLLTPDTFEFFARYVLSGFIIIAVANAFVFGKKPRPGEALLEIVLYSLLNQLLWSIVSETIKYMYSNVLPVNLHHPWLTPSDGKLFYYQVVVLPICIGVLLGIATQRRWFQPVFKVLSLPITDPYPRAYDHVFAEFEGEALFAVHYEQGPSIYGLYGLSSRASRDPDRSELYLERLYSVSEDGEWIPSDPPRSALVSLMGMRAIEILKLEAVEENADATKTDS